MLAETRGHGLRFEVCALQQLHNAWRQEQQSKPALGSKHDHSASSSIDTNSLLHTSMACLLVRLLLSAPAISWLLDFAASGNFCLLP